MEGKFAVLNCAKELKQPNKRGIFKFLKKEELEIEMQSLSILGVDGLTVTLPITEDDTRSDIVASVYEASLGRLKEIGVKSIVAAKGHAYTYDHIIPALSGFYVMPFLLPQIIKKCTKMLNEPNPELLIVDDTEDLTIDILCLVCQQINRITVLTQNTEKLEQIADSFYADSGLNIYVTNKEMDVSTADVIINASFKDDKLVNKYKRGAIYFDFIGDNKKTAAIASVRQDMTVADGMELKTEHKYIDNVLLEAVLYSANQSFRSYLSGTYNNDDFYGVLDKVESMDLKLTTLKCLGARI